MFESIVVGTDGSETAHKVLDQSFELAKRLNAKLLVVSVYEAVSDVRPQEARRDVTEDQEWMFNRRDDVLALLQQVSDQARSAGISEVETFAQQGDPADAILDVAEERGADMILVGNRGMAGKQRFVLGSVPSKVSHKAPCSVLIVRTS
jgi:nucleotide-binding universal stress UspA family protein